MAAKGYLIGPQLVAKIKDTIARVDGMPYGGVTRIPTRFEAAPTYVPKTIRIGTFTGSWSIGASKPVRLQADTASTVSVTNLFFPIPTPTQPNANINCAIAKDGTAWYLIDVPFETATAVFVGGTATASFFSASSTTSTTIIRSITTSQVSYVTNVSARFNTNNCTIVVSTTAATASSVALISTATATLVSLAGTQTMTFATSTFTATFLRVAV